MQNKFNIPKNNPFKVPSGYFDELTDNIQTACYQDEQSIWQVFQAQKWATTLAIVAVFYLGTQNFNSQTLASEDVFALVENEIMQWDEVLLYEYAENVTAEQSDYIDYLIEEDIDLRTILNEL